MSLHEIIQIGAATVGSLGFAVLFNIRGRKLLSVAVGGGLGWVMFLLLNRIIESEAICYFIVALAISLYAEAMARLLKSPTTIFIAPSLIPLVPGASLYYTMAYALEGDSGLFADKALNTLKLAAALAIGIIASAVIMQFILKLLAVAKTKKR